jgi:alkylated DNA repair dioxygenase AlkB
MAKIVKKPRRIFKTTTITPSLESASFKGANYSFLVQQYYPDEFHLVDFEKLWNMRPTERAFIQIKGERHTCPRYTRTFMRDYNFSGVKHRAQETLPDELGPWFEITKREFEPHANMLLMNFYEGDGSIGKHSDDEREIAPNSSVVSWTLGPAKRVFTLESKTGTERFNIKVQNNTLIVMGPGCQQEFVHYVNKKRGARADDPDERRINLTFRHFIDRK